MRLHAIGDVAHERLGEVDLDAEVGQSHLGRHPGACVRLVPNMTRSNRRSSNSARARLAAPIAGMAAVSERNGAIGMRCR